MIMRTVEKKILSKRKEFPVLPMYNNYCLSNIPETILSLFGVKTKRPTLPKNLFGKNKFKKIIVLLIDGFGYEQWLKNYKNHEFFRKVTKRGKLLPLTSVFPSTTAAAMTSLHTGLTPQEHTLNE